MRIFNFAEIKKIEKPKVGEITLARGEDLYQAYNYRMDQAQVNPNDFFEKEKSRTMVEQVRAMNEADPRLWGMMETRKLAILSFERQIMGEGPEADFVREVLGEIDNFDLILKAMLGAIECGFSVTEILWNYLNGKVIVENLLPRCQDKFTFDKDWQLRLLNQGNIDGELMPEKKFLVFTWNGEYGNRFGLALYQKIYWYWYTIKNITKFEAIFCEKHASPTIVGKLPKGGGDSITNAKLLKFVTEFKNHQGITLPNEYAIELLQAQQAGSINSFESFLTWLNNGIAIAVLGQPGSTESSAGGSYAKVSAQDAIRQDILRADISMLESVINDYLIKWLVNYNFPNAQEYPKWKIIYEDKPDIKMLAEVTQILVNAGDEQIPISWIHKKIGIPELVEGEDGELEAAFKRAAPVPMFPPAASPNFAETLFKRDQEIFLKEIKK